MAQGLLINVNGLIKPRSDLLSLRVYLSKDGPFCDSHLAKCSPVLATECSTIGWSKEPAHKGQASAFLKTNLKEFLSMALQSKQKPCQIVKKALT